MHTILVFIVSIAVWKLYPIKGKVSEADFTKSAIDVLIKSMLNIELISRIVVSFNNE